MSGPKLPPFAPDGPCPKCGDDDIHTLYVPADKRRYGHACACHECPASGTEHLDRRCTRCSFQWPEALAPGQPARQSVPFVNRLDDQ